MTRTIVPLLLTALAAWTPAVPGAAAGLTVAEVGSGQGAEAAGLRPGDLLVSWRRPPASGDLGSPFDLALLTIEEAPRGPVTLVGERGGEPLRVAMPPTEWGLTVEPQLEPATRFSWGEVMDVLAGDEAEAGVAPLRELVAATAAAGRTDAAAWMLHRGGRALARNHPDTAAGLYETALSAGWPLSREHRVWLTVALGDTLRHERPNDRAVAAYETALELLAGAGDEGALTAAWISGDKLARTLWSRREHDRALALVRRSIPVLERLAPDSLDLAWRHSNLGYLAFKLGDLETAGAEYLAAMALTERLAPGSMDLASCYGRYGEVAYERGEIAAAEEWYLKALAIRERLAPGSLQASWSYHNLGNIAWERGDVALAEHWDRQALEIKERLTPDSLGLADSYNNLANVLHEKGDLAGAEAMHRQAMALRERLDPGGADLAFSYQALGALAMDRGEPAAGEAWIRRAFEIRQRLVPGSLELATTHHNLALCAEGRGDVAEAESWARQALAITSSLAPGSANHAESLHLLGRALRGLGRTEEALEPLAAAVAAVETQLRRLGGTRDQQSGFRAGRFRYYREYLDLLVEVGRPEDAFNLLERSRASGLLAMLGERDIVFADVPDELARQRRLAFTRRDRAVGRLAEAVAEGEEATVSGLRQDLAAVDADLDRLRSRILAASPRLEALVAPRPLDLEEAHRTLDPGTLLLAYNLAPTRVHLFILPHGGDLRTATLEVDETTLRDRIQSLRFVLQETAGASTAPTSLTTRARSLHDLLIAPAAAEVAAAERLLVIPDGPLHQLPFAALVDGEGRYLGQTRELLTAASVTVFAQLRSQRERRDERRVVAFADPVYPQREGLETAEPVLHTALRSGLELTPLPASREEVLGLGRLYGESARLWLGTEATEERAKSVPETTSVLHFATHGRVDERFPLESAIVLSIPPTWQPGEENGLLQAWEVFEQVRLDADLVTLSACETGLGRALAGEGLVGLTRAFQYAGARSVLASLWRVDDTTTAAFMTRFYRHLEAGVSKSEALRRTRASFLEGAVAVGEGREIDASHPFHWAAFRLDGDWR